MKNTVPKAKTPNIMYTHRIVPVENNYHIHVFDDVLPLTVRNHIYMQCRKSMYQLGWADSEVLERAAHNEFLYSEYSLTDFENLGIIPYLMNTPMSDMISGLCTNRIIVNLSTASDSYYVHSHPNQLALVYYVNLEWLDGWHGDTQFYSNNLKDIEYTSPYTPGRIIVFDGDIPHAIRAPSRIGPKFRYTLSVFFNKKPC